MHTAVSAATKKQNGSRQQLISISQALQTVMEHGVAPSVCRVDLLAALGRVIAEDQLARFAMPSHDYAAMDGYAFRYEQDRHQNLEICGFLPAGTAPCEPVPDGAAVRIMTGALVPPGCDTVVPLEHLSDDNGRLTILQPFARGDNIRRAGEDAQQGDMVIPAGTVVRSQEIALLSAMNLTTVPVFSQIRVAILATGDELLEPGSQLEPGRVINSNSNGLAAMVLAAGAQPVLTGIAADTLSATHERIQACLQADVVLVTGGASAGDYDYVKPALLELGGEILLSGINLKPGKPFGMGLLQGKPVFALPGNPVAAMVTFELFIRPMLLKAMGRKKVFRPIIQAKLTDAITNKGSRPHLAGAILTPASDGYQVSITGSQSSGRIASLTLANGLVYLAPETGYRPGDPVSALPVDQEFGMMADNPWH